MKSESRFVGQEQYSLENRTSKGKKLCSKQLKSNSISYLQNTFPYLSLPSKNGPFLSSQPPALSQLADNTSRYPHRADYDSQN
jgi:Zn-dependent M16 (insulinase) family peptidase